VPQARACGRRGALSTNGTGAATPPIGSISANEARRTACRKAIACTDTIGVAPAGSRCLRSTSFSLLDLSIGVGGGQAAVGNGPCAAGTPSAQPWLDAAVALWADHTGVAQPHDHTDRGRSARAPRAKACAARWHLGPTEAEPAGSLSLRLRPDGRVEAHPMGHGAGCHFGRPGRVPPRPGEPHLATAQDLPERTVRLRVLRPIAQQQRRVARRAGVRQRDQPARLPRPSETAGATASGQHAGGRIAVLIAGHAAVSTRRAYRRP
jgi:hypothetical protein